MDGITVMGLLLVLIGALVTHAVYRTGYTAGQQAALGVLRELRAKLMLIDEAQAERERRP